MAWKPSSKVGLIGEEIAAKFLVKRGFSILERNYKKMQGEIDIIAEKQGTIRFVEVKTVSADLSRETRPPGVTQETDAYRPEENVHPWKLRRIERTALTYLAEQGRGESDWQIDVVAVLYDAVGKQAKVRHLEAVS